MVVIANVANAQLKPENEGLRLSADKFNSVKNGIISPDLYTGTVSLSIPFYTYKDNDFEIPISFDYSSNGCVANARAGVMGPGWTLNVGGCITREIKGIPDERLDYNKVQGFYALHKSNIQQGSVFTALGKLFRIFGYNGTFSNSSPNIIPAIVYCTDGNIMSNLQKYDAEPDIFHFNFMGYSGTFHLGFNDTIYVYDTNINSKDLKIEIEATGNNSSHAFSAINIYTPDGYKYIFNCDRQSAGVEFSLIIDATATPPATDKGEAIAWNLTEIVAPNGRTATFTYEQHKIINYRPATFRSTGNYLALLYRLTGAIGIQNTAINNPVNGNEHAFYQNVSYVPILKSINTDMSILINFDYLKYTSLSAGIRDQYYMFGPLREFDDQSVKLHTITASINSSNVSTTILKHCSLSCIRNSNGARTGYLYSINIQGEGTYIMDYYKWNDSVYNYTANGTFSVDYWGYYNGKNNTADVSRNFLSISTINSNSDEVMSSNNYRTVDANYAMCGMLRKITYPTGGYSTFEYEAHDYSKAVKRLSVDNFIPKLINETGICGGLRIKSIKNYLNSNAVSDTKEFEYKNNNVSSGILLDYPRFRVNYSANLINGSFTENNISFCSSDFENLSKTHVEYSKVTEKLPDGSRIEYNYTNSQMHGYMDTVIYYSSPERTYINGQYISWTMTNRDKICNIVAPSISRQAIRGQLMRKDIFKTNTDQTPLYSEINSYNNNYSTSLTYVPIYLIRTFGYVPVFIGTQNIYSATQIQYFDDTNISKTNTYTYNSHGQIASITNTDSRLNTYITEYKYVTDTTNTGIFANMIAYNILNYPLSEKVYIIKNNLKTLIEGKRYKYFQPNINNLSIIRLSEIYSYNRQTGNWELNIKHSFYDNYGNLLETEDRNGIKTCTVWGYKGLHIVAECKNISLDQIKRIINSNINLSPLQYGITDYTHFQLMYANPGASITIYRYEKNRLKTVIDPAGIVTNYDYDTEKKMKSVSDSKNNLINKYFFNKQQ
jgi:YD repeat-containing protein